jgi:hypothetical protein
MSITMNFESDIYPLKTRTFLNEPKKQARSCELRRFRARAIDREISRDRERREGRAEYARFSCGATTIVFVFCLSDVDQLDVRRLAVACGRREPSL